MVRQRASTSSAVSRGSVELPIIETTWICSIILAFPLTAFPPKCGIKDVTSLLSSVGSSSPPSWLRPFRVLSNGEQFRVTIARVLAEQPELLVFDEFTSVVDRNVAKVASAAIAKAVRRRKQKFMAVSCHHDIIEWLQPDWIYEPAGDQLTLPRGSVQRPKIELEIFRVHYPAWELFRKHHYLDTNLNRSAICFVALWQNIPVAFSAWLPKRDREQWLSRASHGDAA
jgi:hypothetical protein